MDSRNLSILNITTKVVSYIERMADLYERADLRVEHKPAFSRYLESFLKGQAGSDRIFYKVLTAATPGSLGDQGAAFEFGGFDLSDDAKGFVVESIYGKDYCHETEKAKQNARKLWEYLYKQLTATIDTKSDFKDRFNKLLGDSQHKKKITDYICQQAIFRIICDEVVRDKLELLQEDARKYRAEGRRASRRIIVTKKSQRNISSLESEAERLESVIPRRINAVSVHMRSVMRDTQPRIEESATTVLSALRRASKSSSHRKKTRKQKDSHKSQDRSASSKSPSAGHSVESSRPGSRPASKAGSRIQRAKTPTVVLELLPDDPGDERGTREAPVIRQPSPSLLQPPPASRRR